MVEICVSSFQYKGRNYGLKYVRGREESAQRLVKFAISNAVAQYSGPDVFPKRNILSEDIKRPELIKHAQSMGEFDLTILAQKRGVPIAPAYAEITFPETWCHSNKIIMLEHTRGTNLSAVDTSTLSSRISVRLIEKLLEILYRLHTYVTGLSALIHDDLHTDNLMIPNWTEPNKFPQEPDLKAIDFGVSSKLDPAIRPLQYGRTFFQDLYLATRAIQRLFPSCLTRKDLAQMVDKHYSGKIVADLLVAKEITDSDSVKLKENLTATVLSNI